MIMETYEHYDRFANRNAEEYAVAKEVFSAMDTDEDGVIRDVSELEAYAGKEVWDEVAGCGSYYGNWYL